MLKFLALSAVLIVCVVLDAAMVFLIQDIASRNMVRMDTIEASLLAIVINLLLLTVFGILTGIVHTPDGKYHRVIGNSIFLRSVQDDYEWRFVPMYFNGLWAFTFYTGFRIFPFINLLCDRELEDLPVVTPLKRAYPIAMAGKSIGSALMAVEDVASGDLRKGGRFIRRFSRGPCATILDSGPHNMFGIVLKEGESPPDGKDYLFILREFDPIEIGSEEVEGLDPKDPKKKITVPQMGLIEAMVGKPISGEVHRDDKEGDDKRKDESRVVAQLPEPSALCPSHDNFGDVFAFCDMGGQRGNQPEHLERGSFFIHQVAFRCKKVLATYVPPIHVAVIESFDGTVPDRNEFIEKDYSPDIVDEEKKERIPVLREEFDHKRRGIQERVYPPGIHPFNPYIQEATLFDTSVIHIKENVGIISEENYNLVLVVELRFRIKSDDMPKVLAVSGSIKELEEDTIVPRLRDILFSLASTIDIGTLMNDRNTLIEKAKNEMEKVLEGRFAILNQFIISGIDGSKDPGYVAYEAIRARERNAIQERKAIAAEIVTEANRVELARKKAEVAAQPIIANAKSHEDAAGHIGEATKKRLQALMDQLKENSPEDAKLHHFVQLVIGILANPDGLKIDLTGGSGLNDILSGQKTK